MAYICYIYRGEGAIEPRNWQKQMIKNKYKLQPLSKIGKWKINSNLNKLISIEINGQTYSNVYLVIDTKYSGQHEFWGAWKGKLENSETCVTYKFTIGISSILLDYMEFEAEIDYS